jgi:multidrug efflux pump subunit AcrB
VPYPVQFRVVGPDPKVLRLKADEIKAQMRLNPNTRGVNDNWNESVKSVRLEVDQAKARALGVSSQSIAQASRTLLSGSAVGQYREGDKLIEIVLRQPLAERDALSDLGQAYVPTASGRFIPLVQIATPVLAWEPGVMWREGRQFALTVQADIAEGLQGATVTAQLLPDLKKTEATWQGQGLMGYRIEVAGAVEESAKGSASIAAGVPVMLFHLHAAHAATAKLQSRDAGVPDRSLGHGGCGGGLACAGPAIWLCGAAGCDCAHGHDSAQLGHLDRPD